MDKRFEVIYDRHPLSSEDLASRQNFDEVLTSHQAWLTTKWLKWGGGSLLAATVLAGGLWYFTHPTPDSVAYSPVVEVYDHVPMAASEIPEVPQPGASQPEVALANTPTNAPGEQPSPTEIAVVGVPEGEALEIEDLTTDTEAQATPSEEEATYQQPEYLAASPKTGFTELYLFFQENTQYPIGALPDSVEGAVSVSFMIDVEGRPQRVRVANSLHPLLDDEAIRVVESMPLWNPATVDGRPIPSRLTIPITFQIVRGDSTQHKK